jgi:hypothetical protein
MKENLTRETDNKTPRRAYPIKVAIGIQALQPAQIFVTMDKKQHLITKRKHTNKRVNLPLEYGKHQRCSDKRRHFTKGKADETQQNSHPANENFAGCSTS